MKKRKVDVAIIGAGSAGMRAFRAAGTHTDDVVLIEGGELSGFLPRALAPSRGT